MEREQALEKALDWYRRQTHCAGPVVPHAEPSGGDEDSWLVTLRSPELNSTIRLTVTEMGVTPQEALPEM